MNKLVLALVIGALIGAIALGACTQRTWLAVTGAVIGAGIGYVIAFSQAKMAKDRETGLDG